MRYDAIVIGGGHNGLVCAAYLAKAGLNVVVLERRSVAGGAVMTEPLWPGYRVDTCSVLHIAIHATPIVEELELVRFGLRYLPADPWAFAPFETGRNIFFYRSIDRTCHSIAESCGEREAEAYKRFAEEWVAFARPLFALFLCPPTARGVAGAWGWRDLRRLRAASAAADLLETMKPYSRVLEERFESNELRAALAWLGAQAGAPPDEPGGVAHFIWLAMLHEFGAWHPAGGSGMLAEALGRCIEHHGGTVRVNAPVRTILLGNDGVQGTELEGGEQLTAPFVIGAGHVQTILLDLLPAGALPAGMVRRLRALKLGPGTGMTVRIAARRLPAYPVAGVTGDQPAAAHHGMQLYCPSIDYLRRAYHQVAAGALPDAPAILAMTPSAYDRSIVPENEQSLYFWAQWHPYRLRDDTRWEDIEDDEAAKILQCFTRISPDLGNVVDWERRFIQTPRRLERRVGLRGGNIMHLDMSLDQMFKGRPLPELSDYRTPIPGLYLSGASTHPGGGVFGASGYNTAHTLIKEWKRRTQR